MRVYVVTSGSYSDYGIVGIFSTKEKAEEFMGGRPDKFNGINEYDVDSLPPKKWVTKYRYFLRLNGERHEGSVDSTIEEEEDQPVEVSVGERGYGETEKPTIYDGSYRPSGWNWFNGFSYVSLEHAKKLAVEQRQKALVEHPDWFTDIYGGQSCTR